MDKSKEFDQIVAQLPFLSEGELRKIRKILDTLYGEETATKVDFSNVEVVHLTKFYQEFKAHAYKTSHFNLPPDFTSYKYMQQWVGAEEYISSLGLKSPTELLTFYRIAAPIYFDWLMERKIPITQKTFGSNLSMLPTLIAAELPALSSPFVKSVIIQRSGGTHGRK